MYRPSERAARAEAASASSSGRSPRTTSSDASVTYRKSSSKTVEKASKTRVMPAEGEEEGDDAGAASPSPPLPRLPRVPARTSGRTIHRQSTFGRYHPSRPLPSVTTPVALVSTPGVGPPPGEAAAGLRHDAGLGRRRVEVDGRARGAGGESGEREAREARRAATRTRMGRVKRVERSRASQTASWRDERVASREARYRRRRGV